MQYVSGTIESAQKVVVYGPEGIGKSTFASQFPDPKFIDTEGSTKRLNVQRTPKPTSWTMLLDQVKYFISHPDELKTLVIDTADWAEMLCADHVCSVAQKKGIEDFGYGKGYVYLTEEFGRLLNLLEELIARNIHVVLTAHAQMRKFEQPDEMGAYDRWEMKLQKKTAPMLREWADMVLFANYKTYVVNVDGQGSEKGKNKVQGGRRVLYTTHHPCWDAKNRDNLKDELDFTFSEIAHCMTHTNAVQPAEPASPVQEPKTDAQTREIRTSEESPDLPIQVPQQPASKLPKSLLDLMTEHVVLETEIQMAVAKKGYYPTGTPIENYDPTFIEGVLVGAWAQVHALILEMRKKEEIPF